MGEKTDVMNKNELLDNTIRYAGEKQIREVLI